MHGQPAGFVSVLFLNAESRERRRAIPKSKEKSKANLVPQKQSGRAPARVPESPLRAIPAVEELLNRPGLAALGERVGRKFLAARVRQVLAQIRVEIREQKGAASNAGLQESAVESRIVTAVEQAAAYSLRPVINATGVILHTNLGRAPLSAEMLEHATQIATQFSNLEFDLVAARRGERDVHISGALSELLGAEAAIVVNNNAAAVLLVLNTLADGGEVVVSRGELVEIGGSFRIPEVMAKSQAILREVGTTNRTRVTDYERAINDRTRLLLRVHRSNFEITGFTGQPALEELVALARRRSIPLMEDLGSGALFDLRAVGVTGEPGVLDSLRLGVDVVTYSGDKLLGGPQSGLISGRADLVTRMRSNSLFRALRVDKLTYAALEATLLAYVKRDHDAIPAVRMMRVPKDEIARRAEALAAKVKSSKLQVELIDGQSLLGGGAAPSAVLPTCLLAVTHQDLSADSLCDRLRSSETPVIARVEEGHVLLDLRTVFPEQDATLAAALVSLG